MLVMDDQDIKLRIFEMRRALELQARAEKMIPELMRGLKTAANADPFFRYEVKGEENYLLGRQVLEVEIKFPCAAPNFSGDEDRSEREGLIKLEIFSSGDVQAYVNAHTLSGARLIGSPHDVADTILRNVNAERAHAMPRPSSARVTPNAFHYG